MRDGFGREIEYLRISITHRCNLNCIYCSPGSSCDIGDGSALTPEELEQVARSMVKAGIRKVRITGGEPLVRGDVCEIVERISKIEGVEDLSMTTNGVQLYPMAEELKAAGLKRVNISLDSLRPERFHSITGGGKLEDTLKGIQKAMEVGLSPVKLNTVLIRGVNEDEIDGFIALTKDHPLEVRFIELMPIGKYGEENTNKMVSHLEVLQSRTRLIPCEGSHDSQPARYYRVKGYQGRIGFISAMSHKFCESCNRIRLTWDGKIRTCLGSNSEVDIVGVVRQNPEKLDALLKKTIAEKPKGHLFENHFLSTRNMNMIGG